MKATVRIEKSFDDGKQFAKDWEYGDFKEFFEAEGEYLDRLGNIMESKAEHGEQFVVTYTVTLTK